MSVTVEIQKGELKEALRFLRNGLQKRDRNNPNTQLELELFKNKGLMRIKGAEYEVSLSSDRYSKVTMPLPLLWRILRTGDGVDVYELSIGDGKLKSNTGIELAGDQIKLMHPEELATPELPLNYNQGHILKLSQDYDVEAQDRMGIKKEVSEAKKELDKALNTVTKTLEKFNISAKEVEMFVKGKIYGN